MIFPLPYPTNCTPHLNFFIRHSLPFPLLFSSLSHILPFLCLSPALSFPIPFNPLLHIFMPIETIITYNHTYIILNIPFHVIMVYRYITSSIKQNTEIMTISNTQINVITLYLVLFYYVYSIIYLYH